MLFRDVNFSKRIPLIIKKINNAINRYANK